MPKIDVKGALGKKIGPLPAWGWAVAIGGGILVWRMTRGGGSGSGSQFAFTPEGSSSGGGGGGGGTGIPSLPDAIEDLFTPTPVANAPVPTPSGGGGSSGGSGGFDFGGFSFSSPISLPSFGGLSSEPISSPSITPTGSINTRELARTDSPTSAAVGSGTAGADAARAARATVQEAAAKVATPTATAVSQLATQSGLGAAEAVFLVKRQATKVARTAAKSTKTPTRVTKTSAPKKVPTTKPAPTAVTQKVYELAGPNLRGGTRI